MTQYFCSGENLDSIFLKVEVSKEEIRAVIRFLVLLNIENTLIYNSMKKAYGDSSPSIETIRRWSFRFRNGRVSTSDNTRTGRPEIENLPEKVSKRLEEQPFASANSLAHDLKVSYGCIYNVLTNHLQLKHYVTKWVPHKLTQENKNKRIEYSTNMLNLIERKGIHSIITGDESWIFHDNPHDGYWSESQNIEYNAVSRSIGAEKTMISVFWGVDGFYLLELLPLKQKYNSDYACSILEKLDQNLKASRGKGLNSVLFHWDNARPHTSIITKAKLEKLESNLLPHPPYSPDLAPSDFYLFGNLKRQLKGSSFRNRVELMSKLIDLMSKITMEERISVFLEWIRRLNIISNSDGSYCF